MEAPFPLPPARMALVRDGRPLKRWRYAGIFGPDVCLCAGSVAIGPARQAFWAVWERDTRALHERTTWRTGRVGLGAPGTEPRRVVVRGRDVEVDLRLEADGQPVEVVSEHGASHIWTRKQPCRAVGTVRVAGARARAVDARALVDDSAGYHARRTDWEWSAGAGTAADGRAVTWNLVRGVHDVGERTERAVWVDGVAHAAPAVTFSPALDGLTAADGSELRFAAEAVRERHDGVPGLVRSDYVQPFGSFSGALPGGIALAEGHGVMERHAALW